MQEKGVSSSELEELLRALQTIEQISLPSDDSKYIDEWFTERERNRIEGRVRGARKAKKANTKLGRPGAASGSKHWSAKRKRLQERYYRITYPRMLRKLHHLVKEQGWFDVMARGWKQNGWDIQITKEQWDEHIEPILREKQVVPYTERYFPNVPVVSLGNILVYDRGASRSPNQAGHRSRHEKPVFDGAEWKMRQLGYML